ncbi:MAG: SDR family oxidoreductase [Novosphingobium sp.]|nr:SDR family oxidoreductase [Novosphingobium sp.]
MDVVVVIGAGGIGEAIARAQGIGRTLVLADCNPDVLDAAASRLAASGFAVVAQEADTTRRSSLEALAAKAASLGAVTQVVNTAGVSPNMAGPRRVLEVDLYGSALVFEVFERAIAPAGAGLIVSSMAGHMLPPLPMEQEQALAFTPADELLALPFLDAQSVPDSMVAYCIAKRANALRVRAAAMSWGAKGARVNAISPGIVVTPLALHELNSPIGDGYRAMISASTAGRMAPAEEIAQACSWLLGPHAGFVTGTDLLIDGGVIAAMFGGKISLPG